MWGERIGAAPSAGGRGSERRADGAFVAAAAAEEGARTPFANDNISNNSLVAAAAAAFMYGIRSCLGNNKGATNKIADRCRDCCALSVCVAALLHLYTTGRHRSQ